MKLRKARAEDAEAIARVHVDSRKQAMPCLPVLHPDQETVYYFRHVVIARQQVRVAEEQGRVAGFVAFTPETVEHLYVDPQHQSKGIGSALLDVARSSSTGTLSLWMFQQNRAARDFYESRVFSLAGATDGRRNAEQEPDARYCWRRPT